jgi:hypothetical protein
MLSLHTFLGTTVFQKQAIVIPRTGGASGWGSHQIRNDAEWFKADFYK